ncbi:MAG: TolC family protein [Dysgonamonadaceae bacterium]|jgi:outer membrane protein TolC|nr:TolC family protein [Dysgonamonadaceae bacterium]
MKHILILFAVYIFGTEVLTSQVPAGELRIEDALILAEAQSLDAVDARNRFLAAYWQYRNYRADLLPNVAVNGNMPSLNRSINAYLNNDGTYSFVKNSLLSEDLTLSLDQNIPFTDGVLSFQSAIARLDQTGDSHSTQYMSVPYSFSLYQPLFSPRKMMWAMRIEPEKLREAKQMYQSSIETVYMKTVTFYFDVLLAQVNVDIARINLENAVKLHDIARGKKEIGVISDNDLLQLELGKINAEATVISAGQAVRNKMQTLRNYLHLSDSEILIPVIPETYFQSDISHEQVRELAGRNNPLNHTIRRQLMEAREAIDAAKASRGFRADLNVSIGRTGSSLDLPDSYRNLQSREVVSLGIRIPILDWGKGKGKIKLAESQSNVIKNQAEQSLMDFDQNIVTSVEQYNDQYRLLHLARSADSISRLRYETAFQTFLAGTVNILDINAAQAERDNARRKYINEMYLAWLTYYNIRQITLFDFQTGKNIKHEEVINLKKK